jgi:hypothetical protein
MSQRMIELHDSVIASIDFEAGTTIITFSHAYIHHSDGVPGIDPGSGWSQRAELRINQASKGDVPKDRPYRISDGLLKLDDVEYPNEIPIPLRYSGSVGLTLSGTDEEGSHSEISVTGSEIELKLIGEAKYIEDFAGSTTDQPDEGAT